jgi:ubiquinone/menaquinone biosynthesis C-methylase UbiE
MSGRDKDAPTPPDAVQDYYSAFPEETRLASGSCRLEFERTKDVLARVLPLAPACVVDVGGAAGAYSLWLAARGYQVHLVDASPRLAERARTASARASNPLASVTVADARLLPQPDASADAVLVMGPLYHLPSVDDRRRALREAARVLKIGGVLVAAAVSRYASTLDGMARGLSRDPAFREMRDRDLRDGQHRNATGKVDYFTTAFFHRPEDLEQEIRAEGFASVLTLGVEGPGWMLPDFDARWGDDVARHDLLDVARSLEREPSIIGASAHLLGIGKRAQ